MGFNSAFKGLKLDNLRKVELLTYLLTHSTEQSPSREANRFSISQEITCILWNPKVHYRIHTCLPPCPYPEPARSTPCPHIPLPEARSL